MTARAQRAAEVLRARGWDVDECDDYNGQSYKPCLHCDERLPITARYCSNCGAKTPVYFSELSIDDLEAAIQAALGEQRITP